MIYIILLEFKNILELENCLKYESQSIFAIYKFK